MKAAAVLIIALAILAGAVLLNKNRISLSDQTLQSPSPLTKSVEAPSTDDSTSLADSALATDSSNAEPNQTNLNQLEQHQTDDESDVAPEAPENQDTIDVLQLGKQSLDEVSFRYWVSRLRSDPLLLQSALTEYLENSDKTRARNLAAILGEINSPLVLDTATQLSQSTDKTKQLNGLELLARLQPNNTHARNNAIDLLATQSDPSLLVATLNVFATPAQAVSAEQRQLLLDHAQILSTHSDANVRALSISTISNWSRGNSGIAATIGLNDPDGAVRANSAASLIGAQNPSPEARLGLLSIAANKDEVKTTRQLALYALSKMPLSESETVQYEALEIEVRRTP